MMLFNLFFFFFNDTATTEIYTLSLHALFRSASIFAPGVIDIAASDSAFFTLSSSGVVTQFSIDGVPLQSRQINEGRDRKSTRLNSSHLVISYAVFCLKTDNTESPITVGTSSC